MFSTFCRCSFVDGSAFARFVRGLGKRADQLGMVSQLGIIAIGPVANGPRSLVDCIKTPTSPTGQCLSGTAMLSVLRIFITTKENFFWFWL